MANSTRLDDAIEIANEVSGLGRLPVTLVPGDIAHNAAIIARITAAAEVLSAAAAKYTSRNGDLSSAAWIRLSTRRDEFRLMAKALQDRA